MDLYDDRIRGRFFWGLGLIGAGVFLLLDRLGGLPEWMYHYTWWGAILWAMGLLTLLTARRAESVGSGVTLLLLGAWLVGVTNRLYGLTWSNSWPLALVAAGMGTLAHAIAAYWLPDTKRLRIGRHTRVIIDDTPDPKGSANAEGPHVR